MWFPIAHAQKECQLESCALLGGDDPVQVECLADFARQVARRVWPLEDWQTALPRLHEQFDVGPVAVANIAGTSGLVSQMRA